MSSAHSHFAEIANERFWKYLIKVALPLVDHNWHLAEDLVQQTFVILWKTTRYDPGKSSPATYAIRRLRGLISFHHKRCRSTERWRKRQLEEHPGFSRDTNEVELLDELEHVRSAIEQLSPKQRAAINRHEREEQLDDVASKFGVTKQAVHFQERLAVTRLRETLNVA